MPMISRSGPQRALLRVFFEWLTPFARETGRTRLVPVIAIQAAILHRFGHVLGGDGLGFAQVGDSAGQFQDAVVRPRRKSQAPHGHLQGALAGVVERAQLAQRWRRNMGVVEAPLLLDGARSTTARISAEDSQASLARISLYGTAGTSMWISMRSSSGPLTLPR